MNLDNLAPLVKESPSKKLKGSFNDGVAQLRAAYLLIESIDECRTRCHESLQAMILSSIDLLNEISEAYPSVVPTATGDKESRAIGLLMALPVFAMSIGGGEGEHEGEYENAAKDLLGIAVPLLTDALEAYRESRRP